MERRSLEGFHQRRRESGRRRRSGKVVGGDTVVTKFREEGDEVVGIGVSEGPGTRGSFMVEAGPDDAVIFSGRNGLTDAKDEAAVKGDLQQRKGGIAVGNG